MIVFRYLSKILPLFVYPLGLVCILVLLALVLQRGRWQKGVLVVAFLVLFLGGNRWVTVALAKSLEWRYSPPKEPLQADVIVILASGTLDADFPRSIPEVGEVGDRLIYAAHLYQQGAAPLILHCGEADDSSDSGEATGGNIPFLLGIMGVPREAVVLETNSRNTYENAVACKKILQDRGLQRVILVTSAAHMPRSVGVFERQGIDVIPAPTGYTATQGDVGISLPRNPYNFLINLLPNADNLKTTTRMLKEYIGIIIYRLRGWL